MPTDTSTFTSSLDKSRIGHAVLLPPAGFAAGATRVADGKGGSKRPAVYQIGGSSGDSLAVKIKIKNAKNINGPAKLIGKLNPVKFSSSAPGATLSPLEMEGNFTYVNGELTVPVQIRNVPSTIQWYRGDVQWSVQAPQGETIQLNNKTRLEVFFTFAPPTPLFRDGVWMEALRLLGWEVYGLNDAESIMKRVTYYLHYKHGLKYEIIGGGAKYGSNSEGSDSFRLMRYINKKEEFANCSDQAAAVQSFASALGIRCQWYFLQPFSFIKDTHLLGYDGDCNNPMFGSNNSEVLPWFRQIGGENKLKSSRF